MDDDSTHAAYQRELAPYRDAYMAVLTDAWAAYLDRTSSAKDAYQSARNQLRGKYRLDPLPYDGWRVTGSIGPIRD